MAQPSEELRVFAADAPEPIVESEALVPEPSEIDQHVPCECRSKQPSLGNASRPERTCCIGCPVRPSFGNQRSNGPLDHAYRILPRATQQGAQPAVISPLIVIDEDQQGGTARPINSCVPGSTYADADAAEIADAKWVPRGELGHDPTSRALRVIVDNDNLDSVRDTGLPHD